MKKEIEMFPSAHQLAADLVQIHTRGELCKDNEIVYREADIIQVFKKYGFPEPNFQSLERSVNFLKEAYPDRGIAAAVKRRNEQKVKK